MSLGCCIFPTDEEVDDNEECPDNGMEELDSMSQSDEPMNVSIRSLRRPMDVILDENAILAFVCLEGSSLFTDKQYGIFMDIASKGTMFRLPSPKQIRGRLKLQFLRYLYPHSSLYNVGSSVQSNEFRSRDTKVQPINSGSTSPRNCARIVLPSQWAKMDVSFLPFYKSVYERRPDRDGSEIDFEFTGIVQQREVELGAKPQLRARFLDMFSTYPVSPCDILLFPINGRTNDDIGGWPVTNATTSTSERDIIVVCGEVTGTLTVSNDSNEFDDLETDFHHDPLLPTRYIRNERVVRECLSKPTAGLTNNDLKHRNRPYHTHTHRSSECSSQVRTTEMPRETIFSMNLFSGDTISIIRPVEFPFDEEIVCVFHSSPMAHVMARPPEQLVIDVQV